MTCAYNHPDFKRIALSFLLKRKSYISIIHKNGMSLDDFIEDVRSNIWKYGEKEGLAVSTIICTQIKWYIGRISSAKPVSSNLIERGVSYRNEIDDKDEVEKIFNLKCLSDRELDILKMKYNGSNYNQIGNAIGKSRERVKQIFQSASRKIREEYEKMVD